MTEVKATTPVIASSRADPGTPSNTTSNPNRSDDKPRGPNQPMNMRARLLTAVRRKTRPMANGRATNNTTSANASAGTSGIAPASDDSSAPKRTNASSIAISAVISPYSRKQSHKSKSVLTITAPAKNTARKPLPPTTSPPTYAASTVPTPYRARYSRLMDTRERIVSISQTLTNPTTAPATGPRMNSRTSIAAQSEAPPVCPRAI